MQFDSGKNIDYTSSLTLLSIYLRLLTFRQASTNQISELFDGRMTRQYARV